MRARRHEVADDPAAVEMVRRGEPQQGLAHVPDAFAGQRRERDQGVPRLLQMRPFPIGQRALIDLVDGDDGRHAPPPEFGEEAVFEGTPRARLGHHHAQIHAVEDGPRALHPQFAECPLVVHARRVHEQHGPEGQQFHRLLDRVGRGAGHVLTRSRRAGG